ncbi:MAG: SDR family oxidoreductase [Methyloligellaceae bacterium]
MKSLFCFGLGYSAKFLAHQLAKKDWKVTGTARTQSGVREITRLGYNGLQYSGLEHSEEIAEALETATHILISASPAANGDPVLAHHLNDLNPARLHWIGYLSTVGVYGNWDGAWVDETNETRPVSQRSSYRVEAENKWLEVFNMYNLPVHIFRLAGIYGPNRNAFVKLQNGTARRIVKPGQVFNRIHAEDIAGVLEASIRKPNPGSIYNVADDKPCPPQEVVAYAAELLNMEPPPLVAFEKSDLSPMGKSFYGENKRVSNSKIKSELGVTLKYPTFKEGLNNIWKSLPSN